METFWNKLSKPFFANAPMADVTDAAFRALIAKRGGPDVFWTEFVSADGLYHTTRLNLVAENPFLRDLQFSEDERPIVAQIFSSKPEMIAYAAKYITKLGFDGIDINMGCPDHSVEKQSAGAALMKKPALARELIKAAKGASSLSISVKTRIGYNKESLEEWLPVLLEESPAAITVHLRTRKELSLVPARWELMKKVIEIRDCVNPKVFIIGNGDVGSREEGERLARETGCDGIMIGRGMFGNPWVFEKNYGLRKSLGLTKSRHGLEEKLAALIGLAHNFEKLSPPKNFAILKKHIKAFVTGFAGAADLRAKLMDASSAAELERVIRENRV